MEPVNVQAIKIMIKTNIPGQKDIPFTNALLYHPDLSGTSEYNEYPYISDNKVIPNSLVQILKSSKYSDVAYFFFNKNVFLSRLDANKVDADYETKEVQDAVKAAADKAAADKCNKINNEDLILHKNIMTMLNLLFPTVIPVSDNVKDSYSTNIAPDNFGSGLKLSLNSVKEWFSYFKFSFLKIDGKEYTVNRIVWLNDVMNHPTYSGLIEEFTEYKAWSEQTKIKLLKERKKLYQQMILTCTNEITEADFFNKDYSLKKGVPNVDQFNQTGMFGKTMAILRNEIEKYKNIKEQTLEREKLLNTIISFEKLTDTILPALMKSAWLIRFKEKTGTMVVNFDPEKTIIGGKSFIISKKTRQTNRNRFTIDRSKINDAKKEKEADQKKKKKALESSQKIALLIRENYENFKKQKNNDTLDLVTVQTYIDNLGLDNLKTTYKELNKESLFSSNFQKFVKNLIQLYDDNQKIQSIIGRLDNTEYDKTPIPGEYSKITSMMKSLSDNESTNRESTNKCFQDIIDSYVAVKNTPKTETTPPTTPTKSDLENLKDNISAFKKNPKDKTGLDTFYVGITKLNNNDALKAPSFEIYISADVVGGVLDTSNVQKAKCMYKDKKLTKDFYNNRQKLIDDKWRVNKGQFFNVSDIGNKKRPLPNKTIKQPPMRHGGHRTRKIRRR